MRQRIFESARQEGKNKKYEITEVSGITFDETELTQLLTEDDVFRGVREIFARYLLTTPDNIVLMDTAKRTLVAAWKASRHIVQ